MKPQPIHTLARHHAEDTQRRLIAECTCRIIAEHGLEAATLRRVAADLGCTTGLVTHYFPVKEDLLEAALRTALAGLAVGIVDGRAGHRVAPQTLDEWVDQFVELLPTDEPKRAFWRVLAAFRAASVSNDRLAHTARHFADHHKPELRALVRASLPRSKARRVDELTDAIWLMVDGIGVSAALHGEQITAELVRAALRGLWRGLLGRPLDGERD